MVTCRAIQSRLDAYVDGELPINIQLDANCHLDLCPSCSARVRFERVFHRWVKNATKGDAGRSRALERKLRNALIAARACNEPSCLSGASVPEPERLRFTHWPIKLPIAVIAVVAVCWVGQGASQALPTIRRSADPSLSQLDSFLDMMTERHIEERPRRLPNQPAQLSVETRLIAPFALPPMQDVRTFRAPSSTVGKPASSAWPSGLVGVSAPYIISGHRVTFFTYQAQLEPLRARLDGRVIDGQVVYVGVSRGYSVATVEAGPTGFAMTSDLPPVQNARIILSAVSNSGRIGPIVCGGSGRR